MSTESIITDTARLDMSAPVERKCRTCKSWGDDPNTLGQRECSADFKGAFVYFDGEEDCWVDISDRPLRSSPDFGCVLWEAKP